MTTLEGIVVQVNDQGEITHLTLDVSKHKDILKPLLEEIEENRSRDFQNDLKRSISIEEARTISHNFVRKLWQQ
jgi:hypothetical protein